MCKAVSTGEVAEGTAFPDSARIVSGHSEKDTAIAVPVCAGLPENLFQKTIRGYT